MDMLEILVAAVALFAIVFWWPKQAREEREAEQRFRACFERQFRALKFDDTDPLFQFDDAVATVVRDKLNHMRMNDKPVLLSIERFARNEAGEYFLFIANGVDKPFFKHVTQSNAKIALGL